eukprot:scaffold245673_cov32-Tisochrysis_lutea.AAC.7
MVHSISLTEGLRDSSTYCSTSWPDRPTTSIFGLEPRAGAGGAFLFQLEWGTRTKHQFQFSNLNGNGRCAMPP